MDSVVDGDDGGSSYSCSSATGGEERMMGMGHSPSPRKARGSVGDEDELVSGGSRVTDKDVSTYLRMYLFMY